MTYNYEGTAAEFLELSSEQRLDIILGLLEKKSSVSAMAKELDATVPEVYRNFERLVKASLIEKDTDGSYHLTTYGVTVCASIPSIGFVSKNKGYFKDHHYGDIPQKFVQRIGALSSGKQITGFVKVLEQWKEIYKNSNEFIYNILSEVSYSSDLMEPLLTKLQNGVKVNSIFSESAIIPKERKTVIEKVNFKKFIANDMLARKMKKDVKVVVVLNEKEAGVMFPTFDGEPDLSKMFYSQNDTFHEWCLDYFRDCWNNADMFQESKLKQQD